MMYTVIPPELLDAQPPAPQAVCVKCPYGYVEGVRNGQGGVVVSRVISTPASWSFLAISVCPSPRSSRRRRMFSPIWIRSCLIFCSPTRSHLPLFHQILSFIL